MSRRLSRTTVLAGALLASALMARAQEPPVPPLPPFGAPLELLGFEGGHGGKIVKGAPYSASASSETVQKLADGTTIRRTSSSTLFRDSQGRSRRETSLSGFGPLAASGKARTMVTIADPVAGVHYMLDTEKKVAHKMMFRAGSTNSGNPDAETGPGDRLRAHVQARIQKAEGSGALKEESLGTQKINGISATGTRYAWTIPAGEIGNDKPIQVVSERWFSPDLQIVVKSTRTDPRFGTTTYSVTNIQKAEPDASLFTVPADFTVQEGGPKAGRWHGGMGRRGIDAKPLPPPPAPND